MRGHNFEQLADETTRSPIRHNNAAAGPAHACQFGGYQFRPWGEHCADEADHEVKRGIFIGQHFGVAFVKSDIQTFRLGACSRLLKQIRGDVDANHAGARACGGDRDLARAAGYVE